MATKDEAQQAIFDNITRLAGRLEGFGNNDNDVLNQVSALRTLALAYRFAAGGAQPGGGAVPSK